VKFGWAKKKLKPTPVELRRPDQVNSALDELKAGKVLGRIVLDMEKEQA